MTGPDRPAVETGTTSPANTCPAKTRWLYPTLAVTGIAVGIFVVAAGLFLLFAPAGWHLATNDCCTSMEAKLKTMKDDMKNMPCMASTPSTPGTPSMSPMPGMPTPAR
ncbi:hypothetical protein MyChFU_55010 [Mycobacterium intracellulare subsp. chimaera]